MINTMELWMLNLSCDAYLVDKHIEMVGNEIWYRIWSDREFICVTRCCLTTEKRGLPRNWSVSG